MAAFSYRALLPDGKSESGIIEAVDATEAVARLRGRGALPVAIDMAPDAGPKRLRVRAKDRTAADALIAELAVLTRARLPLDRAIALAIENMAEQGRAALFGGLAKAVREGQPLSRAMAASPELFGATAIAMTEAGEANGRLDEALTRLSAMLEQAAELRRTVTTALIYPIALIILAVGVVLMMMIWVVPQFEKLFAGNEDRLPAASVFVMQASQLVRQDGLLIAGLLVAFVVLARFLLARPAGRMLRDRTLLRLPLIGETIRRIESARFVRTLGALIEGSVPLPNAFALAQRTIGNRVMADSIAEVSEGIRKGGGLTAPLAATGALPRIAIGFFRTGEESSQLGPMLVRLADILDRDVKTRVDRVIKVATPLITVLLGAVVGGIIASVMAAILGFNDLAVAQ